MKTATIFTVKNGWKFSITSESGRYSAINLRILKAPVNAESEDFKIWSELNCGASMLDAPTRYTQEFDNAHNEIKKIIESYDFDDSDSMTDYFHSRFYSHIYIDIK
jgi:hypothetical protein